MSRNRPAALAAPDTTILVDRSVVPPWPRFVMLLEYPEFVKAGPAEYDLADVDPWFHDGQKGRNHVDIDVVFEHLKTNRMIENCLGFADALVIQQKGVEVFRRFFGDTAVFFWRSVVSDCHGNLYVPYLFWDNASTRTRASSHIHWFLIKGTWVGGPALRFAN